MSDIRRPPVEGTITVNIPLALLRTSKSQEILKMRSLCHIAIKAEAYNTQSGLTKSYTCQQFCHVWASCKQPLRCMLCVGGRLQKECPEKGNAASVPKCRNFKLVDGEEPRSFNYRGCRHTKEGRRKRESQTAIEFSSSHTIPGLPFAAVILFEIPVRLLKPG
jgi:hypothetical protein